MRPKLALKLGAIPATVAGFLAYLTGYALTFGLTVTGLEGRLEEIEALSGLVQSEPVGSWRVVGWIFYGLHGVDTRLLEGVGSVEASVTVAPAAVAPDVLYMMPVLALIGAGFLAADFTGVDGPRAGMVVGGTVTVGYAFATAVGLLVFSYQGIGPTPIPAIGLAGIAYPLLLGTMGGALQSVSHTFEPRGTDQLE